MALTRSLIAYNLDESPHRMEVPYDQQTLTYVFSSELYKQKFYERFINNREEVGESLTRRFGFQINNDLLCDLRLYTNIEKRGFLILKGEDKFVCREDITLDGEMLLKLS